jgi:hypothetical protein
MSTWAADSAVHAIELLRMMRFDLALVRSQWESDSPWPFLHRMRQGWPKLRWALVAEHLDVDQEIQARTLGASCIFCPPPTSETLETALNFRRRLRTHRPKPPPPVPAEPAPA